MPSLQFGKYQMIKKLATGGMAEVFLAKQQLGAEGVTRHVVVKRILPHLAEDPEFVQMFMNEAMIAAKFSHPNIAQIFDYGQQEGTYFIAMEFVHGEDLGRLMRKAWSTGQWIARPLAIRIIAATCEGLYYAHTRKDEQGRPLRVVHRDISPQNILISFDGSVKLVDFGIAKAADQQSLTKSGAIKGKFAYMAPEQAAGKPLDARTDLFALGLVLYELLTGVRPLKRDSELATLQAALECKIDAPSVVAEVPAELDDVVMRSLAKAADNRYKDARAFQMALEEYLIGQRLVATSVQISELMETLFADRRAEEERIGAPNPSSAESASASPAVPEPPGWENQRKSRSSNPSYQPSNTEPVRANEVSQNTDMARPGEAGRSAAAPKVEDWEAPPAVMPSRRYAQSGPNRMPSPHPDEQEDNSAEAYGATDSQPAYKSNETRAKPLTRAEVPAADNDAPVRPSRLASRRNSSLAPKIVERDEGETDAIDPELATPAPPRRTSSGVAKRRTSGSSTKMPEAPPRRASRPEMPAARKSSLSKVPKFDADSDFEAPKDSTADRLVGLPELRRSQRSRMGVVIGLMVIVGVGLAAFAFKDLIKLPTGDKVPIIVNVTTTPSTHIYVKHKGEKQPADLGDVPYHGPGVFVGDTLLMVNKDQGIDYEQKHSLRRARQRADHREEVLQLGDQGRHQAQAGAGEVPGADLPQRAEAGRGGAEAVALRRRARPRAARRLPERRGAVPGHHRLQHQAHQGRGEGDRSRHRRSPGALKTPMF
ncbi:MAG: protein kinase [Myxococcaceae bacterium]